MNSLVQTRCDELIIQQGYTDPYVIPDKIEAFKGVTKTFHLQFNNWLQSGSSQFVVNNVSDHTNIPKKQENVMTAPSASEGNNTKHTFIIPATYDVHSSFRGSYHFPHHSSRGTKECFNNTPPVSDDPQQQTMSTPVSKAVTISPITPPNTYVHKRQLLNSPDSKKMKSANAPKSKQD